MPYRATLPVRSKRGAVHARSESFFRAYNLIRIPICLLCWVRRRRPLDVSNSAQSSAPSKEVITTLDCDGKEGR